MYTDDTALIITGDNIKELEEKAQIELANVSEWFVANKLTINTTKTKYTVFHSHLKIICNSCVSLHMNQCPLKRTYSCTYLGVILDHHLNWQHHIEARCSKLASGCFALFHAREHFPRNSLRILYFSFFQSHLTYCIEPWAWNSMCSWNLFDVCRNEPSELFISHCEMKQVN